ncbi:MAG: histidinol-phosphate aminotransferase family protein [Ktedonobacteraceae bacterium]|nr:histidinol-phosphate aminotransferase family protein [Ktedonobacteraceae bacterium]
MPDLALNFVQSVRPIHGALDYNELARLGLHPDEILDFSVNSNPYGPSPAVRAALARLAIERYPDRECLQLRQAILDYELPYAGLSLSSLVCGNGVSELIWALAHAYLGSGVRVALLGPTFGEYAVACRSVGADIVEFRADSEGNFQFDLVAMLAWLDAQKPRMLWFCNPNNPTGGWLDLHRVSLLARACQDLGTLLIVDESYYHFVSPPELFSAVELLRTSVAPYIVVLRSLTKDFALAGLRLGYAVSTPAIIERLSAYLPSWNVNAAAQLAGCAALADRVYLAASLEKLAVERRAFFAALAATGCRVISSRTHYCLIEVGNAAQVRRQLLERKILVRDCTSFGLPSFIRVATRPVPDWQRLLQALQEVV